MIYTDKTKLAMKIAYNAHQNQFDKCGVPYIFHPLHLAEQMQTEETVIAALLHDVVEDTYVTFDELSSKGFSDNIIDALRLLTHDKSVDYFEYISLIKDNPIAAPVKLADLRHNSDLSRLDKVTPKDIARKEKYEKAIEMLCK